MRKIQLSNIGNIGGVLEIRKFPAGAFGYDPEMIKTNLAAIIAHIKPVSISHNKVVSGSGGYGRNLVMRKLSGDNTYGIAIDSAAIGSGSVAPADSDTGLGNSLVSGISITNFALANNVLTIDVFITNATLPNNTYSEFGFFIGGRLFSRVLISPVYTKATGEDTLFTYTLTFTG